MFGNTKQVIQDYDTVFDNSIPFRKNNLLRITYFRIPGVQYSVSVPGLHFVPWHRGNGFPWCVCVFITAGPITKLCAGWNFFFVWLGKNAPRQTAGRRKKSGCDGDGGGKAVGNDGASPSRP